MPNNISKLNSLLDFMTQKESKPGPTLCITALYHIISFDDGPNNEDGLQVHFSRGVLEFEIFIVATRVGVLF